MALRIMVAPFLALVMASPSGGSVNNSTPCQVDPFRGIWKCVSAKTWDANGKEINEATSPFTLRIDRDRMCVHHPGNNTTFENAFRLLDPKNFADGQIDILDKDRKVVARSCYRFSEGRFYLCMKRDEPLVRPNHFGAGKDQATLEFVPFQPNRLVQSHPVQYPPKATR